MFLTQPPFWSRSMLCCVLISGERYRLLDQSIRVVSARSQHLLFKWNFWRFDLSMRLLVMTSHGSVYFTSFDRLKMLPHPVTVRVTAFTDVGLGALSFRQTFFQHEAQKVLYKPVLISDLISHFGWSYSLSNFRKTLKSTKSN